MQEMSQGEDYIEDEVDADTEQEGSEQTGSGKIFGIDTKIFAVIVLVFVFIVILLIVLLLFKNKSKEPDLPEPGSMSAVDSMIQQEMQNTAYTPVQQPMDPSFSATVYTEDWANRYTVGGSSYTDGTQVSDPNGTVVGTFSTTDGTPLINSSGVRVGFLVAKDSGITATPEGDAGTQVTDESIELLRKMGYTGDEIEFAIANNVSVEDLVSAAEALHDTAAQEALVRMSDFASEEFQFVYNNSIISLGEIPYAPMNTMAGDGVVLKESSYMVNADYEKMPTYGLRLYFKVKIANNTYTFMPVTPRQWDKYPDSGNIVVSVNYTLYADQATGAHLYITDIKEMDVTNMTVNPEDSGVTLEKAVGLE